MSTVTISSTPMATARLGRSTSLPTASSPKLRLTPRGRAVLLVLAAIPVVLAAMAFALNGGSAAASLSGSDVAFQYVTVDAGESLWQVAETIAPNADPRDVIDQLISLNRLESAELYAGQELAIPAQYAH